MGRVWPVDWIQDYVGLNDTRSTQPEYGSQMLHGLILFNDDTRSLLKNQDYMFYNNQPADLICQ